MQALPSSSVARCGVLALAATGGVVGLAQSARACSFVETAIEASYPRPGAVGVPTNVVLYASGEQIGAGSLSLETLAGEPVPVTVSRVVPTGFDVTPVNELEPNQRYLLLDSRPDLVSRVEFETGSGPAAPHVLAPPELTGALLLVSSAASSCPGANLCVEPAGTDTMLFAAHPDFRLYEFMPGILIGHYGNADVPDDCLQVWRRDALGARSETVRLCGADVPRFEIDEHAPATCEELRRDLLASADPDVPRPTPAANSDGNAATAREVAGCMTAGTGASSGSGLGAVLALLVALGVRRRRPDAEPTR